jgi:hypothetical protein
MSTTASSAAAISAAGIGAAGIGAAGIGAAGIGAAGISIMTNYRSAGSCRSTGSPRSAGDSDAQRRHHFVLNDVRVRIDARQRTSSMVEPHRAGAHVVELNKRTGHSVAPRRRAVRAHD